MKADWTKDPDGNKCVNFCNHLQGSGDYIGETITLRPWQERILRQLFGTKNPDGTRKYKTLFLALPRKQGKTAFIACIVLYLLVAYGKRGQVIVSASGCQDQAGQIYEYCRDAIEADKYLSSRLVVYKNQCKIVDAKTGNYYRALTSDKGGDKKMGKNVSVAIFDEGAFWDDEGLHKSIVTSMGTRRDPLRIYISTAGFNTNSWFFREWQYALDVRSGAIKDPEYLPVIHASDPTDDPFAEATWHKAMPALGDFCQLGYIRSEFERAKHSPEHLAWCKALYLNLWSQPITSWLSLDSWDLCRSDFTDEDLDGWQCLGGLDLGIVRDLSSLALLFRKDGRYRVKSYTWLPREGIEERSREDKAPYDRWAKDGWVTLTDGNSANNAAIREHIKTLATKYHVEGIYADRFNAYDLATQLNNEGVPTEFYSQGIAALSFPSKKLHALILDRKIEHDGNPLLRWAIGNVSVKVDENENIKPVKRDGKDGRCRIDPVMALIMALGATLSKETEPPKVPSVYLTRGILTL